MISNGGFVECGWDGNDETESTKNAVLLLKSLCSDLEVSYWTWNW